MFGSKAQPTAGPEVTPQPSVEAQAALDAERRKRAQMAQAVMSMSQRPLQGQQRGPTTGAGATAQALSQGVQAYLANQARLPADRVAFNDTVMGQALKKFTE